MTAESGEEGLEILRTPSSKPDLILLDVNMVGMNGPEFLIALGQKYPQLSKEVPVVFLTATDNPPPCDVAGTINKSMDLDAFLAQVRRYLH